jgi:hypothetical protein
MVLRRVLSEQLHLNLCGQKGGAVGLALVTG